MESALDILYSVYGIRPLTAARDRSARSSAEVVVEAACSRSAVAAAMSVQLLDARHSESEAGARTYIDGKVPWVMSA